MFKSADEPIVIKTLNIDKAKLHIKADAEGNANYDIVKPSADTTSVESDTASSDFKLTLKSYEVENLNLTYEDIPGEIKVVINDLDHEGVGDFTQEVVDLKTKTSIGAFTAQSGGVAYLNKVHTEADMDFQFNQLPVLVKGRALAMILPLTLSCNGRLPPAKV